MKKTTLNRRNRLKEKRKIDIYEKSIGDNVEYVNDKKNIYIVRNKTLFSKQPNVYIIENSKDRYDKKIVKENEIRYLDKNKKTLNEEQAQSLFKSGGTKVW